MYARVFFVDCRCMCFELVSNVFLFIFGWLCYFILFSLSFFFQLVTNLCMVVAVADQRGGYLSLQLALMYCCARLQFKN